MDGKDLVKPFGGVSEFLLAMTKLSHQVKAKGGDEEYITLFYNDAIIDRMAEVLARAGRLGHSFAVDRRGVRTNGIAELTFIGLTITNLTQLDDCMKNQPYRLATKAELDDFFKTYRDALHDEDWMIVGERRDDKSHWVIYKSGQAFYTEDSHGVYPNFRFAIVFE